MADTNTTTLNESDVKNLTSAMQQFTKAITDNNKLLLKGKTTLKDTAKTVNEIHDTSKKQETLSQKIANSTKDWGTEMKNVLKSATGFSKLFVGGSIAGFFANLVKDTINLDNEMTKLSWQMGKGKDGIKELKGAVNGLQIETGASYESAVKLVSTLAEEKYVGNIQEAAAGISLFSRATGVAEDSALQLTNTLSKGAGLSDKSINAMYAGMIKVQQSVGISKNGMSALTGAITSAATSMAAMGKSGADIQKVTNNMTALAGSLEKVGISAQTSAQMIENMLDPDKIEDNIMLYSQLGISMSDALSGDISLDGMESQLKDMAQKIVDMGPIAGKQFAQTMGMTYKQATQMAKMDAGSAQGVADAAKTSEEEAMDTLKKLEDNTDAIFKKAEKGINKLSGLLRNLPIIIMATVPLVINKVTKLIKGGFNDMFGEKQMSVATEGVGSAIAMNVQKGLDKAQGTFKQAKNGISAAIGEWFNSTSIGSFFDGVDAHINALYARAQKESIGDKLFGAGRTNLMDSYNNAIETSIQKQEQLKKMASDMGVVLKENETMEAAVARAREAGVKISAEQEKALFAIGTELQNQVSSQQTIEARRLKVLKIDKSLVDNQQNTAKALQEQQDKQENLNRLNAERVQAAKELDEIETRYKNASTDVKKALETELKLKKSNLNNANKTLAATVGMTKEQIKNLDVNKLNEKVSKQMAKNQDAVKNATVEAKKAQEDYNKALEQPDEGQSKILKAAKGVLNNMKAAATVKFNNSTFGQAFNEAGGGKAGVLKGAGAVAKKGAVGAAKGVGKALGGIMKSIGPMAIVMKVIGKVLDKLQDPLEALIDNLMEFLQPVMDILIRILGPALTKIVKGLFPPLLNVLATMLQVLRFILAPIQKILKALSKLPGIGKAFEGVSDVLDGITSKETTDALRNAAESISNAGDDLTTAAKKQEDSAENKPKEIVADGAKFVESYGGSANKIEEKPKASEQASSTTTSTKEQKTDEEKNKENAKEAREKANLGLLEQLVDETTNSSQGANQFTVKDLLYLILQAVTPREEAIANVTSGKQEELSIEEKIS